MITEEIAHHFLVNNKDQNIKIKSFGYNFSLYIL